eukprot:NODE_465_length_8145_cov_0.434999.p3 type:complete len:208 gc:universal NODE_465_length_8145_cov_0.434999:7169-7792(+)
MDEPNPGYAKAKKTLKSTALFLTIWFAIVIAVSVTLLFFLQFSAIVGIFLCAGYIYTLYQKNYTIKQVGFWIHAVFSGCCGTIAAIILILFFLVFNVAYQSVKQTTSKSSSVTVQNTTTAISTIIILFVVFLVFYALMSIVSVVVYWKHCKAAKKLKNFSRRISRYQPDQGRVATQEPYHQMSEPTYDQNYQRQDGYVGTPDDNSRF